MKFVSPKFKYIFKSGCGDMEQREMAFGGGSLRLILGTDGVFGVQNHCHGPMVLVCGNPLEVVGWIFLNFFGMMWVMVLV